MLFSLLVLHVSFAQDEFGLLVKTDYEAKVYFDRHIYQLRDDGEYPDIKKADGIFSTFVATQTVHPSPLTILKDKEEIFATTLPPISNTERYVLSILSTESSLERFEISSSSDNLDNTKLKRQLLLGIISILTGIFFGFRIKRKEVSILEVKDQLPPKNTIPSQIIPYRNKDEISQQLASISDPYFVIFIGSHPSEWNDPKNFGRWFFIEKNELFDIKRYIQQMRFGESVVFVYTDPENIVDLDCQTQETQRKNINMLLEEHPENILVFLPHNSSPM